MPKVDFFFQKIIKICKPLTRLIRKKERRHKLQISEMRTMTPLQVIQILKG